MTSLAEAVGMTETPVWMTTSEVAAELRMSQDYVTRMCAQKALKAKKLGKQYRIHRDDLDRFMRAEAPAPPRDRGRKRAK